MTWGHPKFGPNHSPLTTTLFEKTIPRDPSSGCWRMRKPTPTQVYKVLDRERTELRFNSEWFGAMDAADMIRLAAQHTVARMLERDDFAKRYKSRAADRDPRIPVSAGAGLRLGRAEGRRRARRHRPEVQPAGRAAQLQEHAGQPPQIVLTMPLLEGIDGVAQDVASRSATTSASTSRPNEIFGKIMKISDDLMWRYFELLSFEKSMADIARMREDVAAGASIRATSRWQLAQRAGRALPRQRARPRRRSRHWHDVVQGGGVPQDLRRRRYRRAGRRHAHRARC